MTRSHKLVLVFVALVVRGVILWSILDHPTVALQPDSKMYLSLAQGLVQKGCFCYPERPDFPDAERTPGYPFFLAGFLSFFGESLIPVLLVQILLDSLSCLLLAFFAESLWKGSWWIGGILGALNLGMISYSLFILNDSLFLLVFLFLLFFVFRLLRQPRWSLALAVGGCLGVATLIRPVLTYFPLFLLPFLFVALIKKTRASYFLSGTISVIVGVVFLAFVGPWLARNFVHYGRATMSAQGGTHLLQYIVPSVWQYSKRIPFIEGMTRTSDVFHVRMRGKGMDIDTANPFYLSDLQTDIALEYLRAEPFSALAKAWVFGAVKNLFAPGLVDISYLLKIDRPHFFYTKGNSVIEQTLNFIRGMEGGFAWFFAGNMLFLLVSRLLQVWGFVVLLRSRVWEGAFCLIVLLYFLLISGPIGYAKYRLPFEPILIVMQSVGVFHIWVKLRRRREEMTEERFPVGFNR
jgi:4-amino-4-deoxy-L-arabinose transferase-like glycosyltransferase